jgi:signal transduction histidine kinase
MAGALVFPSLVRVHTIQREVQDLGVAVAAWGHEFQGVIAAHGGQVTVQSIEGQGTIFTLVLPRAPA